VCLEEAKRPLEEAGHRGGALVCMQLDVGEARVVVGPPPLRWTAVG
jgi:hypothetical protein